MRKNVRCRAGEYRHRIGVAYRTAERSRIGELTGGGAPPMAQFYVWGKVEPRDAFERFEAQQLAPEVTHRVECRYINGITSDAVFLHEGRELEVVSRLDVDERHTKLIFACRESVPSAQTVTI